MRLINLFRLKRITLNGERDRILPFSLFGWFTLQCILSTDKTANHLNYVESVTLFRICLGFFSLFFCKPSQSKYLWFSDPNCLCSGVMWPHLPVVCTKNAYWTNKNTLLRERLECNKEQATSSHNELIIFMFCRCFVHSVCSFFILFFCSRFIYECCEHENNVIPTKWRRFVLLEIIYVLILWTRHERDGRTKLDGCCCYYCCCCCRCFDTWIVSIFSSFIL